MCRDAACQRQEVTKDVQWMRMCAVGYRNEVAGGIWDVNTSSRELEKVERKLMCVGCFVLPCL